ncbi:MAG: CPBP family intramembrane metalloprotease [Candidatus Omnitrophica bacterium]|nr:CPBP family intramembrane metalloprotease [Candidatus Omnitrophota bacterium]
MKSLFKFLAVFAFILFLSSLAAPLLYRILPYKFERIFNRLVMIQSLAAIFIFLRGRNLNLKRYGLVWSKPRLMQFLTAFFLTLGVLFCLEGLRFAAGVASWRPNLENMGVWIAPIIFFFLTGLLVALIEEFFFRGFVFLSLAGRFPLALSFILTNMFYSLLHFVSRESPFIGPEPNFWDSLKLIQAPFLSLVEIQSFWPHAFGLFVLGLVLSGLFWRTGSLYPSMGLHAGGVFFVKADGFFVDLNRDSFWLGTKAVVDGALVWILILFLGWGIGKMLGKTGRQVTLILVLLGAGTFFPAYPVFAAKQKSKSEIYSFSRHLPEARAQILFWENEKKLDGIWKEGAWVFEGLTPEANVGFVPDALRTSEEKFISFNPVQGTRRFLIFEKVPPGPILRLEFELHFPQKEEQRSSKKKEFSASYMDFRIFLGKHRLKRIRLSNQEGRIRQDIDMGVAAFFKEPHPVSFELSSEKENQATFLFRAKVLSPKN